MEDRIRFAVADVAKKQGIPTYYALAKHCGVQVGTARLWWKDGLKAVPLDTLAFLCRKLNCQPGDILTCVSEIPSSAPAAKADLSGSRKR